MELDDFEAVNRRAVSPWIGACLRRVRRLRQWLLRTRDRVPPLEPHVRGDGVDGLFAERLRSDEPFLYGRLGRSEVRATLLPVDIAAAQSPARKALAFVRGRIGPFWWDRHIIRRAHINAGLFPPTPEIVTRYAARMLADIAEIDILGVLHGEDRRLVHRFPEARRIPMGETLPFHRERPWTEALAGRRVLVVYPFAETIRRQYAKRERLFRNPRMLPEFELLTLKTVQSVGGTPVDFPDWFAALEAMCHRIETLDFDVALIGAGAYGLPLGAFVKRLGKQALHLGGETQMLFGIRGRRWDQIPACRALYNEHWTYPSGDDIIPNAQAVEEGCYW